MFIKENRARFSIEDRTHETTNKRHINRVTIIFVIFLQVNI